MGLGMKWIKLSSVAVLDAVGVVIVFVVIGNSMHSTTGEYLDRFSLSSSIACVISFGALLAAAKLESNFLGVTMRAILISSICATVIACVGIAVAIAEIAGRIG